MAVMCACRQEGGLIPVTSSVEDLSVCGLRWHSSGPAVSHTFCLPQHEPIPEAPLLLPLTSRMKTTSRVASTRWVGMPGWECAVPTPCLTMTPFLWCWSW